MLSTWEAIAENKRRSGWLIAILLSVMTGLAAATGYAWSGTQEGALLGAAVGLGIWLVLLLVNMAGGESVLLSSANAREVSHDDAPQLCNIVEELRIAAALPAMPKVYIIDTEVPNAFAVGLKPERACVAVTTGLLGRLNRAELQGVLAHELGHIRNRDTMFMTMAGVMIGAVALIANILLRSGGMFRGNRRDRGGNAIVAIVVLVCAILAPLAARLLYFACSRQREYLADASAAQFTRDPGALASALEKISAQQSPKAPGTNRVVAPMCVINPLAAAGSANIFGTHPPTEERIRRLLAMEGRV
jgi:heat shock protein HtpX